MAASIWFSIQIAFLLISDPSVVEVPLQNSPPRITLVHVGKTGGEWVKSQLAISCKTRKNPKIRTACLDDFEVGKYGRASLTSQFTIGYMHANTIVPRNALQLATHYLFTTRQPIHRIASWYVYNHPHSCDPREWNSPSCKKNTWKKTFYECFPTLEHLASFAHFFSDPVTNPCSKVFWQGYFGVGSDIKEPNHLYWNYRFYSKETLKQSSTKGVLALRQENLLEDFMSMEKFLSLSLSTVAYSPKWRKPDSHHYLTGRVTRKLTAKGQRNLCCLLQEELPVYSYIIQSAENLPIEEKRSSLDYSLDLCQVNNSIDELNCDPLPTAMYLSTF